MDERWHALAREAAVAAEHLGIGATALGRANYAQSAYFGQALFALSVGIERSCKLALVSEHAVRNKGEFPHAATVRTHGHDLPRLLQLVTQIGSRYTDVKAPHNSTIHDAVMEIVTTFANNVTRYYNLESLTRTPDAQEPAAAWFERVTMPVLTNHASATSIRRVLSNAQIVDAILSGVSLVRFQHESGVPLTDAFSASAWTGLTELARPWERMYVLRIARHLGLVLSEISFESYQANVMLPHYGDFFGIFNNDDRYLRSRKTWSIYGR